MRTRILLILIAAAAIVAAGATAAGSQHWTDPVDDAGTAAELTDVAVSNDDAGTVTFRLSIANRESLTPFDDVYVVLDSDADTRTGNNRGHDLVVGAERGGTKLYAMRWDAGEDDWVDIDTPQSLGYAWESGAAVLTVARRDLGMPTSFRFWVGSWNADTEDEDVLPERGDLAYSLNLPFALHVVIGGYALTDPPAGGSQFVLATQFARDDTGATVHTGTITCSARVGGKDLKPAWKPHFLPLNVGGDTTQAVCGWIVPKAAKGKVLRSTVTLSLGGKSATRLFSAKVR
jgi:hypothetical protein